MPSAGRWQGMIAGVSRDTDASVHDLELCPQKALTSVQRGSVAFSDASVPSCDSEK